MKKRILTIVVPFALVFVILNLFFYFSSRNRGCRFPLPYLTISSVGYGIFSETFPATGQVEIDSSTEAVVIAVEVNEFYQSRISVGKHGTTEIFEREYALQIINVDTTVFNDYFNVKMIFSDSTPLELKNHQSIRLRIALSEPSNEILLPVGGFYMDTGGKWILVVRDGVVIRKEIMLGRKSPDYFQVLRGLEPGDKVITSPYQSFSDLDLSKPQTLKSLVRLDESAH